MGSCRAGLRVSALVFLFYFCFGHVEAVTSPGDAAALTQVYTTLGSPPTLSSWVGDPCTVPFLGVTCDTEVPQNVIGLDLSGLALAGQLDSSIGNLMHLQILRMHTNQLTGAIPYSIGQLPRLQILDLSSNPLQGSIPDSLGSTTSLVTLLLANCELQGIIPPQLGSLSNLLDIDLSNNQLVDAIPTSLGNLASLRTLVLHDNLLTGPLPPQLAQLLSLLTLQVQNNKLTGELPAALADIPGLQTLDVSSNQLTGAVPPGYSKIANFLAADNPGLLAVAPAPALAPALSPPAAPAPVTAPPAAPLLPAAPAPGAAPPTAFPPPVAPIPAVEPPPVAPVPTIAPPPSPGALAPAIAPPLGVVAPAAAPPLSALAPPTAPPPAAAAPLSPPAVAPTALPAPAPVQAPGVPPVVAPAVPPSSLPLPAAIPAPTPAPFPVAVPPAAAPVAAPPLQAPAPSPSAPPARPPPALIIARPPPVRSPPPILLFPPPAAPPPLRGNPPPLFLYSPPPQFLPPSFPPPPLVALPPLNEAPPPPPTSAPPPAGCPACANASQVARGNGDCTCVDALLFTVRFDMDYGNFIASPSLQKDLRGDLEQALSVSQGQVTMSSSRSGSVIADMALVPQAPATALTAAQASAAQAVLGASSFSLKAPFNSVKVLRVTPPVITLGGEPPASLPSAPSPGAPAEDKGSGGGSSLSIGAIVGIAIGGAAAIAAILLILYCCCCFNKRSGHSDAPVGGRYASDEEKGLGYEAPSREDVAAPAGAEHEEEEQGDGRRYQTPAPLPPVATHSESSPTPLLRPPQAQASSPSAAGAPRKLAPVGAAAFTVAQLQMATDSFAEEYKLGEGNLGTMYLATLPDGKELAVKQMDRAAVEGQSDEDFTAIVANMARLRHVNIVPVEGYCIQYGQRLIVFPYYAAGTVFDFLHDPERRSAMTWDARISIASGCAKGLAYLHEDCVPAVVHRNLKSTNVLLDAQLQPKVADAGLAVFSPFGSEASELSEDKMSGLAYKAPEYAMSGIYTAKSDVYSYGVVLLELLTGRPPLDPSKLRTEQSLVRWAAPLLHDADQLSLMLDPELPGPRPDKVALSRFADIITRCIQPEPEYRPAMSRVVQDLSKRVQKSGK